MIGCVGRVSWYYELLGKKEGGLVSVGGGGGGTGPNRPWRKKKKAGQFFLNIYIFILAQVQQAFNKSSDLCTY